MKKKLLMVVALLIAAMLLSTAGVTAAKTIEAKSVSVAPKTIVLAVGDVAQLNATKNPKKATDKLTWSSSDKAIATVSSKGVVQGVSEGTATITVKTTSKKTAECKVVVRDYATKSDLTDSLIKQLSSTFATKDEIKQTYYSKSEIDAKLSKLPASGGGGTTIVNNCDCEKDFKDGDPLTLYSGQQLPLTIASYQDPIDIEEGSPIYPSVNLTINSISINKSHDNQFRNGAFNPYKYVIEIKGIKPDIPENAKAEFYITYLGKDKTKCDELWYPLYSLERRSSICEYSTNGDEFTFKAEQYNLESDCAYFFIKNFSYRIPRNGEVEE